MTRLFTGDYSSGDFSQWESAINKSYSTTGRSHPARGSYSAQIVGLGDCGYAARFELRSGDEAIGETGKERAEVYASTSGLAALNSTRWYAFSLKFDPSWPDQIPLGWMVLTQWHDVGLPASPTISLGWPSVGEPGYRSGYWYLVWNPQSAPGASASPTGHVIPLVEIPLDLGQWHDIKMRVTWSSSDVTGTVEFWHNGVKQTFLYGGGTVFVGRTCCPGTTGVYVQQGIYRQSSPATSVLYHRGMRMASTEDSL